MTLAVESPSNAKHYIGIYLWLLIALLASLGLGALRPGPSVVFAIFSIALVKAFLVVSHFMHLKAEPRAWKVLMASTLGVLGCLFVGSFPDVSQVNGRIEAPVAAPAASPGAPAVAALASGDATPGDPEEGAKVYSAYCVACHQLDGRGLNGKLAANFVDDRSRLAKSDAELLAAITNGLKGQVGQMPPWGPVLKPKARRDVLAYVRRTFGKAAP